VFLHLSAVTSVACGSWVTEKIPTNSLKLSTDTRGKVHRKNDDCSHLPLWSIRVLTRSILPESSLSGRNLIATSISCRRIVLSSAEVPSTFDKPRSADCALARSHLRRLKYHRTNPEDVTEAPSIRADNRCRTVAASSILSLLHLSERCRWKCSSSRVCRRVFSKSVIGAAIQFVTHQPKAPTRNVQSKRKIGSILKLHIMQSLPANVVG
jgi:hypothetical protein